jgi:hypothetical protein
MLSLFSSTTSTPAQKATNNTRAYRNKRKTTFDEHSNNLIKAILSAIEEVSSTSGQCRHSFKLYSDVPIIDMTPNNSVLTTPPNLYPLTPSELENLSQRLVARLTSEEIGFTCMTEESKNNGGDTYRIDVIVTWPNPEDDAHPASNTAPPSAVPPATDV